MTIKLCPASILLYAAIASIPVCAAIMVYVRPDNDYAHCPGEPCNPLSYYEQPNAGYFAWVSDTKMVFLNGVHVHTIMYVCHLDAAVCEVIHEKIMCT